MCACLTGSLSLASLALRYVPIHVLPPIRTLSFPGLPTRDICLLLYGQTRFKGGRQGGLGRCENRGRKRGWVLEGSGLLVQGREDWPIKQKSKCSGQNLLQVYGKHVSVHFLLRARIHIRKNTAGTTAERGDSGEQPGEHAICQRGTHLGLSFQRPSQTDLTPTHGSPATRT